MGTHDLSIPACILSLSEEHICGGIWVTESTDHQRVQGPQLSLAEAAQARSNTLTVN